MSVSSEAPELQAPSKRIAPNWIPAALAISILVAVTAASPFIIRDIDWDWLNVFPCAIALYLCVQAIRMPWPSWFRVALFSVAGFLAVETALRVPGYHRTLYYERVGDLLFTPVPNQTIIEKLSLTRSASDENGLRVQPPVTKPDGRKKILCLGDSITYGIGLPDSETYPALLQKTIEERYPGRFLVLNAGVNAYPVSFEHQRFLYLWNRGVRPDLVIIGFSMNEGWLGHLVTSDASTKDEFESRVKLKNLARSFATYNYLMEKLATYMYNRLRLKLVPGTHNMAMTANELDERYEQALQRLSDDVEARVGKPVLVDFCSLNYNTKRYDTKGDLQQRFAAFATSHQLRYVRTDEALGAGLPANAAIDSYFFDPGHMNVTGTRRLAPRVADFLKPELDRLAR